MVSERGQLSYLNDIKAPEGNKTLDGGEDPRSTQLIEEWEGPREEVEGQSGCQVLRMRGVEEGKKIRGGTCRSIYRFRGEGPACPARLASLVSELLLVWRVSNISSLGVE